MTPRTVQLLCLVLVLLAQPYAACAGSYSAPELRICSQNLARLGAPSHREQIDWRRISPQDLLISRFLEAHCDLIAVQEVYGEDKPRAQRNLDHLASALSTAAGRQYLALVGDSSNEPIRNGLVYCPDALQLESVISLYGQNLPKLSLRAASHTFHRGPLAALFTATPHTGSGKRRVLAISFHLKSKIGGWKDPTNTDYETLRLEMAEQLRTFTLREATRLDPDTIAILLGDTNSGQASATNEVLRGTRFLEDFRPPGSCRISQDYHAACPALPPHPPAFSGLLALRALGNPNLAAEGSYRYQSHQELIDEIFVRSPQLAVFERPDRKVAAGFCGQFNKGSDHKLLWAELNW